MAARMLPADVLATRCAASEFDLDDAGAGPAPIVGQERARAAVEFGIALRDACSHLFVMGPPGTGRRTLVRRTIAAHAAADRARRSDWVYVHNFEQAHCPLALQLPSGRGAQLRADMRALVDELRSTIPAAFESEEYVAALDRLNTELKERVEGGLTAVGDQALARGVVMLRTPAGFTFAPRKGDEVMASEDFEALPAEERLRLQQVIGELQDQLVQALRASMRMRKEHADRVRDLNRATAQLAVDHAVEDLLPRYADLPAVGTHLEAVRHALIDNAAAFRPADGEAGDHGAELARYEVNLVVDTGGGDGDGVVEADPPSSQHLLGRVDHVAHFGTLVTDFRFIKAGQLHRANGGHLLVDALKLLQQPFAWSVLKRALLRREIRIESPAELFGMVSTVQLEPQPIPLDVKVVLVGERDIYHLLRAHDPEFDELFGVVADLGDDMPRAADTQCALAGTLRLQARAQSLLEPDAAALARLVDHAARRSGDATRLAADVRHLQALLREADQLARRARRERIGADDVAAAIAARRERAGRVDERVREAMQRGLLAIASSGSCVGQVNGLAAYEIGGETWGLPSRITATTRIGEGQVIDIQRETRLSGPLHAKGVLILSSFLAARFSRWRPHAIAGSLVFEQTYGLVEGDSASLAELVALLSSIGEVPVRQGWAVTGSVDQFGAVLPVGAVNEKAEAFFDLCAARGLDGTQGVLLPAANASQLMLRDDVVDAVRAGRFALACADTVDDALELLTGLAAGDAATPRDDTANGRVARRLAEFSALHRGEPRPQRRVAQRRRRAAAGRA